MKLELLGGLSADTFLRRHWQKKPLLVRDAIPGFVGLFDRTCLTELACHEDAQARLITRQKKTWQVAHGPFAKRDLTKLPRADWTLLVQGINHFLPEAQWLLQQFDFVPYARLDDLMVSFAPPGGGVGPHFDSYDVFLLQGMGQRLWQISSQRDVELIDGAPLRILRRFRPEQEWVLDPGDMLYLPPRYAHNGIALNDCMTYSIGFRAPSAQELATQFLIYLQDHIQLDGMYRDPNLAQQKHPAQIGDPMLQQISAMLAKIRWSGSDVARFLGQYLSEPKAHIFFEPPAKPIPASRFLAQSAKNGVRLDLRTQMLFHGRDFYVNGERYTVSSNVQKLLMQLADRRALAPQTNFDREAGALLYQWYCAGYIALCASTSI